MSSQLDAKAVARDLLNRHGMLNTSHRPRMTRRRGLRDTRSSSRPGKPDMHWPR
jgi:hypothetical protein